MKLARANALVAASWLLLLGPAAAQQTEKPQPRTPTAPTRPAPKPVEAPAAAPSATIVVTPAATPVAVPAQESLPPPATAQATTFFATPTQDRVDAPPPLGSELRSKLKEDARHFVEKYAAASIAFDARQAQERKSFEATSKEAGFWEARRQRRALRATQAEQRRAFIAEQDQKRRTYEWRFP